MSAAREIRCARPAERPEDWVRLSAGVHCGGQSAPAWLAMERFERRWTVTEWREYVAEIDSEDQLRGIRRGTHTGRPLGDETFVRQLEKVIGSKSGGAKRRPTARRETRGSKELASQLDAIFADAIQPIENGHALLTSTAVDASSARAAFEQPARKHVGVLLERWKSLRPELLPFVRGGKLAE